MLRFVYVAALASAGTPALGDPGAVERIRAVVSAPGGGAGPGCAVGVFRNGKPAEVVSAGKADIATGRALNSDTQFYAASASKQFTAVAVMQLVAAGKLGLDDNIRTYLPELPDYGAKITPLMLLNHTAGIRDSLALLTMSGRSDMSAATYDEAITLLLKQRATKFAPGSRFDYSNGGYLLLAEIVARVAKEPFHAYVNAKVLKPLGMTRSFVLAGARTTDANVAHGYRMEGDTPVPADNYPLFGGSGGLITTVNDLGRWDRDIDTGHKVWTPTVTRLMTTAGKFTNGSPVVMARFGTPYGAALMIGPNWFQHSGSASGFKTLYARLPKRRIGLALLCNNGDVEPLKVGDAVIAALKEGLPPISERTPLSTAMDGRFHSADLDAVYVLAAKGDTLEVTVLPETGTPAPRRVISLQRDEETGGYQTAGLAIMPDDDASGFTLETSRVSLHFDRAL